MRNSASVLVSATVLALMPVAAQAYIGPGIGAGAVAAVLGVMGSLLLAVVAVVYYPIKRVLKRRRSAGRQAARPTK